MSQTHTKIYPNAIYLISFSVCICNLRTYIFIPLWHIKEDVNHLQAELAFQAKTFSQMRSDSHCLQMCKNTKHHLRWQALLCRQNNKIITNVCFILHNIRKIKLLWGRVNQVSEIANLKWDPVPTVHPYFKHQSALSNCHLHDCALHLGCCENEKVS